MKLYAYLAATAVALALAGFLLSGLYNAGKNAANRKTTPIIKALNEDLAHCRVTVAQQGDALTVQNAAIDKLAAEAEERAQAADKAIRKAQQDAQRYRDKAERIARIKPTDDLCKSADLVLTEGLQP